MLPEHFDLSSPLFLPVTRETCKDLLELGGPELLSKLTYPELAAVLAIQNLAQAAEKDLTSGAVERVLIKLISWSVDTQCSSSVSLLSEAERLFDRRKLYFGIEAIKNMNVRFLQVEEVTAQEYLLSDGKWDALYKIRYQRGNNPFSEHVITPRYRERWLSPAQDKLLRTFKANLDEDLHVQGYAGIGKSHLLGALIEYLRPERTLLLARTPGKLEALRARMRGASEKKMGWTFLEFARAILQRPSSHSTKIPSRLYTKEKVAQELNILGFKMYDAQGTLTVCLSVLERYCRSKDRTLCEGHIPHFNQPLSKLEVKVLLEYSVRVWKYLGDHSEWGSQVGLGTLLMIKWANLEDCVVPPRYTHVLIDESQDVPPSLLQVLERGRQVLITLGDEYQQVKGLRFNRSRDVRRSDISYSVRSGPSVERLVNPLISRHSKKCKAYFEGARDADVSIEYYPLDFVPPQGCVVLTASRWDTMRWIIELNSGNCPFMFPTSEMHRDLMHFMAAAIALFKPDYYSIEQNASGQHTAFSEMSTWQEVRDANQFDQSFLWIEAQLERGFNVADMTRLSRVLGQPETSCMMMMAEDAGGMEFDRVLLTPELLTTVTFKDAQEFDERICAVYIAVSRAKQQIYLPYDVTEWITYHSTQNFRDHLGF